MTTQSEAICVGIDDQIVELSGKEKAEYIRQRQIEHDNYLSMIAKREAKVIAKAALLERLGITADEAALLLQ